MNKFALLILTLFCYCALSSKQCGDSDSYCESYETCCQAEGGGYSCCPYINGVCCAGDKSCCPQNNYCIIGGCIRTDSTGYMFLNATKLNRPFDRVMMKIKKYNKDKKSLN